MVSNILSIDVGFISNNNIYRAEGDFLKEGNYELMQFTGLSDKNGKEIYEGDIVEYEGFKYRCTCKSCDAQHVQPGWKGEVGYYYDRFCVRLVDEIEGGFCYEYLTSLDKITVIGNIYENPELLQT